MSEMVDRVAKALCHAKGYPESVWQAFQPEARTAIRAMREPTDEQRNAYYELSHRTETFMDAHWERAIDAALTK